MLSCLCPVERKAAETVKVVLWGLVRTDEPWGPNARSLDSMVVSGRDGSVGGSDWLRGHMQTNCAS